MISVSNIKLSIEKIDNIKALKKEVCKKINCKLQDIEKLSIYKRSIDARKGQVKLVYTVDVTLKNERVYLKHKNAKQVFRESYQLPKVIMDESKKNPIVIGMGPAGLFCALILAKAGLNPIVFERGEDVDCRTKTVQKFWRTGELNTESNVQFGEGGAGAFSDGKLTTNIKDMRCRFVLQSLVEAGAPDEIMYINKPHVGTDILKDVVRTIRNQIIALGGKVYFNHRLERLVIENDKIVGAIVNGELVKCNHLFLALGHSARDTFEMLHQSGVEIIQKSFAIGVRIEHPQKMINQSQLGTDVLGAADYKLTYNGSERSVYTFCMCPGGMVVGASSEKGRLAINGMSEHARNRENANSALLVQVKTSDYHSEHPLAGVAFQRSIEEKAFKLGGADYSAPIQTVAGFLNDETDIGIGEVVPSYRPATKYAMLKECLPEFVVSHLKEALPYFGTKIKGFDRPDAILTAVESRSSSPIRIVRNQDYQSSILGLYPVGEGAGYAGGIMSAAVDGIKVAEYFISNE